MSAVDWGKVASDVGAAVAAVVGARWGQVKIAANAQITALVEVGKEIEANHAALSDYDYQALRLSQQRALEGVLAAYDGIAIVAAEQAAAAAWDVLAQALKAAGSLPFVL